MSSQYIFATYKLSRRYPPDREVLADISLSFLPGAKIGVLGYNGAGKSTLLRIMAGLDTEFDGQAQLAPAATVGLLEQEPQLDPSKNVRENIEDAVGETKALLEKFNELSMNYSEETADEFARVQERIEAADGGPSGHRPAQDDRAGARVGAPQRQRQAQQAQGTAQRLRGAARRGAERQAGPGPDPHSGRAAAGECRGRGPGAAESVWRAGPDRRSVVHAAAGRDRRRDRAKRRGQDDAVADDHR